MSRPCVARRASTTRAGPVCGTAPNAARSPSAVAGYRSSGVLAVPVNQSRGAGRPGAGVRAEQQEQQRRRHRPGDVPDRRPFRGGRFASARCPLLRPAHAVGEQQRRLHAYADRPADRPTGPCGAGGRSVQPVLHPGRQILDRHGRGAPADHLFRPEHDEAGACAGRPWLQRGQPRRLLRRRPLLHRHLRVRRPVDQGRRRQAAAGRHAAAGAEGDAAGHEDRLRRRRLVCRGHEQQRCLGHRRRQLPQDRLHPHRQGRARPVSPPGRQGPVRHEPWRGVHLPALVRYPQSGREVAHPGRRQPRHGGPQ